MKTLTNFIQEKYLINNDTNTEVDLDNLTKEKIVLYDDTAYDEEDIDDKDGDWYNCTEDLKNINNEYDHFLAFKGKSIMNISSTAQNDVFSIKEYYNYKLDLYDILYKIINNDLGYAIRINGGHIEIDCINSGSRCTYYIYAISGEGDCKIEDEEFLDFYTDYDHKYVIPIELKNI